ncbi:exopolysaccharide biosynthesis protein [Jannaschia pohangensis]|uniref:Uncharacterized conserved protein n=1 Tax=Jannaschia pohangensis TaxID=390807 RepID=A0A1I3GST8_9RHOB|nr:exopolysaccharide biosynthesis protein [Jannaschia pohangensis]SFI26460.1 Uncharacterized conserved protein [Jannaschia pohangensis]
MSKATDILDALEEAVDGNAPVTVAALTESLGHRGTGALLVVPAALEMTPLGGVPGVPSLLALIVALFAVQILMGRDHMWVPSFIGDRATGRDRLCAAVSRLHPAAQWVDRHLGRHLTVLVDGVAPRFAALAILALCLTVPVLELVPFASSIPMAAIVLFGLALTVRDGRLMALAWAVWVAALVSVWSLWP